jgi:hypothetical protein
MGSSPLEAQPRALEAEPRVRAERIASGLLLFALGVGVSLYFGRRGFMPLDQSIVFDGGWRVLSGQVPFRDYHAPNGFVAHAIQAVFFHVLGVSWLSYCMHAAIVNGLFALLAQRVLAGLGLGLAASTVYAGLSALVLYPPIGVPFMDTHAFFFSLLAVWLALAARRSEANGLHRWPWLLLPTVMVLAALSKQIPAAYVPPIVLVIALWDERDRRVPRLLLLAAGSAAVLLLLGLWAAWVGVDWEQVDTYFRRLPSEEGRRRYAEVAGVRSLLDRIGSDAAGVGLGSIVAVHVTFLGVVGSLVATRVLGRLELRAGVWAAAGPAVLGEALLAVCLLFTALTLNQAELGVPYIFIAAGLAHLSIARLARALEGGPERLGAGPSMWTGAARAAGLLILAVALRDGLHFTSEVNATRSVNDITWSDESIAAELPPGLEFMRWQVSPFVPYDARDLTQAAEFLAAQDRGFLLIGDASVLYGLTGKPSAAPSLWFHPGLTVPGRGDPALRLYEQTMLERMERLDVRYLVVEGRHTWNHISVGSFPRLATLVRLARERHRKVEHFGGIAVIDLTGP